MEKETKVVNVKNEDCDVYIGRGKNDSHMNSTPIGERGWLGNPYRLSDYSREESIEKFKEDFYERLKNDEEFRAEVSKLVGKRLGCWCKPKDCHGDVIKKFLDDLKECIRYMKLTGQLP